MPVVAGLLVGGGAVLFVDERVVGTASQGIVPAESVVGDGAKDARHVRVENRPGGEAGDVLRLQGVGQIQTLREVVRVQEDCADVRVIFDRSDAQRCAALQNMRPGGRSGEVFLPES